MPPVIVEQDSLRAEVFCVPDHYPVLETETGAMSAHGWYWWYIKPECGFVWPDSYPSGPHATMAAAMADMTGGEDG